MDKRLERCSETVAMDEGKKKMANNKMANPSSSTLRQTPSHLHFAKLRLSFKPTVHLGLDFPHLGSDTAYAHSLDLEG